MRKIGKTIKVEKYISVDELAVTEKITEMTVTPDTKNIAVVVESLNAEGEVIYSERIDITGGNYDLLFSDDPIFETGKQIGSYREVDLWRIIDKLSA